MYTNLLKYKHQVQKERWYYFNTLRAAFQPFCWFAGSDPEQGPCCRSHCSALAASLGCCDSSPFQMQFPMAGRSLGQATATSYGTGIMCIHCILSWDLAKAYLNTTKQQGFAWRCHIPEVPSHPCQTHWKLVRLHKHLCKMLLEYRRHISTLSAGPWGLWELQALLEEQPRAPWGCHCQPGCSCSSRALCSPAAFLPFLLLKGTASPVCSGSVTLFMALCGW